MQVGSCLALWCYDVRFSYTRQSVYGRAQIVFETTTVQQKKPKKEENCSSSMSRVQRAYVYFACTFRCSLVFADLRNGRWLTVCVSVIGFFRYGPRYFISSYFALRIVSTSFRSFRNFNNNNNFLHLYSASLWRWFVLVCVRSFTIIALTASAFSSYISILQRRICLSLPLPV